MTTKVWDAPPALALRAAAQLDLLPNPILATFGIVRPAQGPARRAAQGLARGTVKARPRPVRFTDLLLPPLCWITLAEHPGEEIVAGQIGPMSHRGPLPDAPEWSSAADFRDFCVPGYAKVAISLRAHPCGTASSILTVETRVTLTDPGSRRQLRRSRLFAGYLRMRHVRPRQPEPVALETGG